MSDNITDWAKTWRKYMDDRPVQYADALSRAKPLAQSLAQTTDDWRLGETLYQTDLPDWPEFEDITWRRRWRAKLRRWAVRFKEFWL